MAELMLKVGTSSGLRDGATIHGMTDRRILCCQSQNRLFRRNKASNNNERADGEGLMNPADAALDYFELTHEMKFQNLGSGRGRITRLSDGETIDFESRKPFIGFNGKSQAMDLKQYLSRRRRTRMDPKKPGMPMFGTPGHEIWFGGKKDFSETKVAAIWDAIENKLQLSREDHQKWPVGNLDVKHYLAVKVASLDERQAAFIEQGGSLGEDRRIEKRTSYVDYYNLPGLDPSIRNRIPDRVLPVDIRDLYSWAVPEILMEINMLQTATVILAELKAEIENDPENLYDGLDDAEIVTALNASNRTYQEPISSAELLAWVHDASDGEEPRILKLEAAVESTPSTLEQKQVKAAAKGAVKMVERDNTSLDLSMPSRQKLLGGLQLGGVLSTADVADLTALATVTNRSRAEQLWGKGAVVFSEHVVEARR